MSGTIASRLEQNLAAGRPDSFAWIGACGSELVVRPEAFRRDVRAFAGHLAGAVPARTVVPILVEAGPALFRSFFGAIAANVVPTILATPNQKTHGETYARNVVRLLAHYGSRTIVIEPSLEERLGAILATVARELGPVTMISPDARGDERPPAEVAPDTIAFLQHSSGSTGVPKGVAFTHAKVLRQIESYARSLGLRGDERIASWLPLYHDMGLVACCLLPALAGVPVASLAPHEWVVRPEALLEVVARRRATHVWLPNFAFAFMAKRVRPDLVRDLDLSSLRAVVSCSEPVLARSLDAFHAAYAPRGVPASTLSSSYAMAENVFAVTQTPPGRAPARMRARAETLVPGARIAVSPDAPEIVSSGVPIEGSRVAIRSIDAGEALPRLVVGEICLAGECLFEGYFQNAEATRTAFRDGEYRTGDIGFLDGDELYVLGRIKDLIIVGGRNFYPTDIEALASEVPDVKEGRVVAFGVLDEEKGTEVVACLVESARSEDPACRRAIERAIKAAAVQRVDCAVERVVVLPVGALVKTSSGKIARAENRRLYLEQLSRPAPRST